MATCDEDKVVKVKLDCVVMLIGANIVDLHVVKYR